MQLIKRRLRSRTRGDRIGVDVDTDVEADVVADAVPSRGRVRLDVFAAGVSTSSEIAPSGRESRKIARSLSKRSRETPSLVTSSHREWGPGKSISGGCRCKGAAQIKNRKRRQRRHSAHSR